MLSYHRIVQLNLLAATNTIHDMNFNCVRWLSQLVARLVMLFGAVNEQLIRSKDNWKKWR